MFYIGSLKNWYDALDQYFMQLTSTNVFFYDFLKFTRVNYCTFARLCRLSPRFNTVKYNFYLRRNDLCFMEIKKQAKTQNSLVKASLNYLISSKRIKEKYNECAI